MAANWIFPLAIFLHTQVFAQQLPVFFWNLYFNSLFCWWLGGDWVSPFSFLHQNEFVIVVVVVVVFGLILLVSHNNTCTILTKLQYCTVRFFPHRGLDKMQIPKDGFSKCPKPKMIGPFLSNVYKFYLKNNLVINQNCSHQGIQIHNLFIYCHLMWCLHHLIFEFQIISNQIIIKQNWKNIVVVNFSLFKIICTIYGLFWDIKILYKLHTDILRLCVDDQSFTNSLKDCWVSFPDTYCTIPTILYTVPSFTK